MVGMRIQVWTKNSDSSLCADVLITEIYTVSRYRKPGYTLKSTGEERHLENLGAENITIQSDFHERGTDSMPNITKE